MDIWTPIILSDDRFLSVVLFGLSMNLSWNQSMSSPLVTVSVDIRLRWRQASPCIRCEP